MEVAIEVYLSTFDSFSHHLLNSKDFRERLRAWCGVLSVKVLPRKAASVVAYYDTVWIKHWYNLKYISVSESLCHFVIACYKLNQAFNYETAV